MHKGTVHALLGANGSGKSTLVKSLAGVQTADAGGTITAGSQTIASDTVSPAWAKRAGLRFVHQNPGFFPSMSVADNLAIGHGLPQGGGLVRGSRLKAVAAELLDRFGISVSPDAPMGDLRLADQTMIAIARALQVKLGEEISALVLDEPTAALPEEDVEILLESIRRAANTGTAVIYISHRLEEVLAISDTVTILRDGHQVVTEPSQGLAVGDLVTAIVGKPIAEIFPHSRQEPRAGKQVMAEMRGVSGGPLQDVSLTVGAGEILGIAGLLGSGRSELLRSFFGMHKNTAGSIWLEGREVNPTTVAEAMELGIAYIPRHRETEAAFGNLSVRDNISAADVAKHATLGFLHHRAERRDVESSIGAFRVKTDDDTNLMSSLSGGNQQKVILARWMRRKPKLLLLDEPTQGVDVGARADAYQLVRKAVETGGAGAILVTSDFEELAEMSDRVLILSGGKITAEVSGQGIDRHRLTELVFRGGQK